MPSFLKSTLETPLLGLSEPVIDNGLLLFLVCDQKNLTHRLDAKLFRLFPKFKSHIKEQSCSLIIYVMFLSQLDLKKW